MIKKLVVGFMSFVCSVIVFGSFHVSASYPIDNTDLMAAERVVDVIEQKISDGDWTRDFIVDALKTVVSRDTIDYRIRSILKYTINDLQNEVICTVINGKIVSGYDGVFSCGLKYTLQDDDTANQGGLAYRYATLYTPSGEILMKDFPLEYFCGDVCTTSIITDDNFSRLIWSQAAGDVCRFGYEYAEYNTENQLYDLLVEYSNATSDMQPHNLVVKKGNDVLTANFVGYGDEEQIFNGVIYTLNNVTNTIYSLDSQMIMPVMCGYSYEEQLVEYPNTYYHSFEYNRSDYTVIDQLTFQDNFATMTLDLETLEFDVEMK